MSGNSSLLAVIRAKRVFYEVRAAHVSRHRDEEAAAELRASLLEASARFEAGSIERWVFGLLLADPWADLEARLPEATRSHFDAGANRRMTA